MNKLLRISPLVLLLGAHEPFDGPAEEYRSCIPEPTDDPSAAHVSPVPLRNIAIPSELGPTPTGTEWTAAPEVALARPLPRGCRAHVSGAWLRVRCSDLAPASGAVLTGPTEGVTFDVGKRSIEVVFSLRRGTSRMIQLTDTKHIFRGTEGEYTGVVGWQEPVVILSQHWPESSPHPIVSTDQPPESRRAADGA